MIQKWSSEFVSLHVTFMDFLMSLGLGHQMLIYIIEFFFLFLLYIWGKERELIHVSNTTFQYFHLH